MSHISFDASKEAKYQKDNVKGYGNHVFRKSNDKKINHSNEKIDESKTPLNEDYFIDGESFDERIDKRIKDYHGRKKLRSNAVYVRGIILQPSADIFEGKTQDEQKEIMSRFTEDVFPWLERNFTRENIMGMSEHHDETNPHLHVAIMPMTSDGRLRQNEFFKSPAHLAKMHRDLREHMNNLGWDFDTENKYENAKGYDTKEYKANAEAIEDNRIKKGEIEKREEKLDEKEIKLTTKERELEQRGSSLLSKEKELQEKEDILNNQEIAHQQREDEYKQRVAQFNAKIREYKQRVSRLTKLEQVYKEQAENVRERFIEALTYVSSSKISEWERKKLMDVLNPDKETHTQTQGVQAEKDHGIGL